MLIYSLGYRHAVTTKLAKCGPCQINKKQDVSSGLLRRGLFFPKRVWGQMFQPKLWAQDRQVKSLPQAREIGNFQTSFGDGFNFSKMRAGTNVPAQTLEARRQSEVPVMGYENLTVPDKSRRRCLFFVKVAVMTNVPAQALRSRRKSEVLAMGCGSRTFPDKLLHRSCFFRNGCGDKWCRPNFGDKMAK